LHIISERLPGESSGMSAYEDREDAEDQSALYTNGLYNCRPENHRKRSKPEVR
jgi:hypothetical protein